MAGLSTRHAQTASCAADGDDRAASQKRASLFPRWLQSTALAGAAFVPDALHSRTWNGSADTDFANAANWDGGTAPVAFSVVTISGGAHAPVVSADAGKFYRIDLTNLTLGIAPAATLSTFFFIKWMSGFSLAATFEGEFAGNVSSYAGKGVARHMW